jgi:hypothetical protein
VVANAKYVNLEEPPRPAFFQAAAQDPGADVLLIRAAGDPAALAASVCGRPWPSSIRCCRSSS